MGKNKRSRGVCQRICPRNVRHASRTCHARVTHASHIQAGARRTSRYVRRASRQACTRRVSGARTSGVCHARPRRARHARLGSARVTAAYTIRPHAPGCVTCVSYTRTRGNQLFIISKPNKRRSF